MLRSDGVTIHDQPLVPGSVYDGDILGFDLSVINSASSITCNWKGFGLPKTETIDNVLSGMIEIFKLNFEFYINGHFYDKIINFYSKIIVQSSNDIVLLGK